ncbi:protein of unknown function [Magnetospirillum sp. XM-1]|nr:protein of unknown function [Magnetospirillum sp. XM-1]
MPLAKPFLLRSLAFWARDRYVSDFLPSLFSYKPVKGFHPDTLDAQYRILESPVPTLTFGGRLVWIEAIRHGIHVGRIGVGAFSSRQPTAGIDAAELEERALGHGRSLPLIPVHGARVLQ